METRPPKAPIVKGDFQRIKLIAHEFLWTVGEVPVDLPAPTTFVSSKFTDDINNEWILRLKVDNTNLALKDIRPSSQALEMELMLIKFSEGVKVVTGGIADFCACENDDECYCLLLGDGFSTDRLIPFTFTIGGKQCTSFLIIIPNYAIGVGKILKIHFYMATKNELQQGDCCPQPMGTISNRRISSARPSYWRRLLCLRSAKVSPAPATILTPQQVKFEKGERTASGTETSSYIGPHKLGLWNMTDSNVKLVESKEVEFVRCNFIWELGKVLNSRSNPVTFLSPTFEDVNSNQWLMKVICEQRECALELILIHARVGAEAVSVYLGKSSICSKGSCCQHRDSHSSLLAFIHGSDLHTLEVGKGVESLSMILPVPAAQLLTTSSSNELSSIHCELFIENLEEPELVPRQLSRSWKDLQSEVPDFTIVTTGKSFPAHKAVLSARSPFFAAMFRSGLSETQENQMNLSAFSEPVVEGFLEFIYTDRTRIIPEYADELLRIADMYDVIGLRDDVGHAISQELSDDTAVEAFCSAHTYNAERLKTTVTNFLKRNPSSVVSNKAKIKELAAVRPDLAAELLMAVAF